MAALRGKDSPSISKIIPQELLKTFHVAVHLFDDVMVSTPSLHMMKGVLTEAVVR